MALCGFGSRDTILLSSALKLSKVRGQQYEAWNPAEGGKAGPTIYLVDDTAQGWKEYADLIKKFRNAEAPVISVGNDVSPEFGNAPRLEHYKRPIMANKLLKQIDEILTGKKESVPLEVKVRDEPPPEDEGIFSTTSFFEQTGAFITTSMGGDSKILVVDDSAAVRKLMEVKLRLRGSDVDFAEDGETALSMARRCPYDLIFLDVMLPGIDGYDVCKRLKKEVRVSCPVVMLTGRTSRIDRLRGTLASCDGYLTKPLSNDDLEATLNKFLF